MAYGSFRVRLKKISPSEVLFKTKDVPPRLPGIFHDLKHWVHDRKQN